MRANPPVAITRLTRAAAGILLLAIGACSSSATDPVICTAEARPALVVEIRDAKTLAPIAAAAVVEVRDGSFVETLSPGQDGFVTQLQRWGVYERAGTYTIEVRRSGYATLTLAGIVVGRDQCHVITRTIQANLTPLG